MEYIKKSNWPKDEEGFFLQNIFFFKKYNVEKLFCNKLRFALINAGCFSKNKSLGVANDDIYFDNKL